MLDDGGPVAHRIGGFTQVGAAYTIQTIWTFNYARGRTAILHSPIRAACCNAKSVDRRERCYRETVRNDRDGDAIGEGSGWIGLLHRAYWYYWRYASTSSTCKEEHARRSGRLGEMLQRGG